MPKDKRNPLTFRLGRAYLDKLDAQATQLDTSRNLVARHLVTSSLNDADKRELETLRHEVHALRQELRTAVQLLILTLKDDAKPKDIYDLVTEELGVH